MNETTKVALKSRLERSLKFLVKFLVGLSNDCWSLIFDVKLSVGEIGICIYLRNIWWDWVTTVGHKFLSGNFQGHSVGVTGILNFAEKLWNLHYICMIWTSIFVEKF